MFHQYITKITKLVNNITDYYTHIAQIITPYHKGNHHRSFRFVQSRMAEKCGRQTHRQTHTHTHTDAADNMIGATIITDLTGYVEALAQRLCQYLEKYEEQRFDSELASVSDQQH